MPYQIEWLVEDRVIFNKVSGYLSLSETFQITDGYIELFDASPHDKIHILVDFQEMTGYELNLSGLRQSSDGTLSHNKMGWLIAYGLDATVHPMVRFTFAYVTQFFRTQLRIAQDHAEAVHILKRIDHSFTDTDFG